MNKLVSIVMPSYNTGQYIRKSIESVFAQTYDNWELIIIDDCSTDDTELIINDFLHDTRVKFFKNKVNSGAAISRNIGIQRAVGTYIAFLDSDDIWSPIKLERQVRFMEQNNITFSYTYLCEELNGKMLPFIFTGPKVVSHRKFINYCYISTITAMYNREIIGLIQIPDLRKHNDYAMWLKISEKADCYCLPLNLSCYIKHDQSISSVSKLELIKHHYILFEKMYGYPKMINILLTLNNLLWGVLKNHFYKIHTTHPNMVSELS